MSGKTQSPISMRGIIGLMTISLYTPVILFLAAGQWDWWQAWLYSGLTAVLLVGSRLLVLVYNPELAAERSRLGTAENVAPWDKKLLALTALSGPISLLVAGLDQRLGWSQVQPEWLFWPALVTGVLGYAFSTWALLKNQYFSSVVRIQVERGHQVCTSGPYRFVRHPGYAGGLLWYLVTPLLLDSWWAFLPTLVTVGLTVLRTSKEDRKLRQELPGYGEYASKVRYRLLPGVW